MKIEENESPGRTRNVVIMKAVNLNPASKIKAEVEQDDIVASRFRYRVIYLSPLIMLYSDQLQS